MTALSCDLAPPPTVHTTETVPYAIGSNRSMGRRELDTSFVKEQTGQLWNPDFSKMTEAMGGRSIRIEHPDQFRDAYAEALRSNIPTVLDAVINRDTRIPVTYTWQKCNRRPDSVRFVDINQDQRGLFGRHNHWLAVAS